jgi:transposase
MPWLTEVQRGQAIALLMQGQRQQQAALQFGVNVSVIERLVRRLRDTGRVADRPQWGRLRVMTPRQDRAIRLAHLRNRHVTATETALTTVGNHNCHIHPKTVRNRLHEFGLQLVDLILVLFSLVHVARVIWLGWRHMVPDNFQ